MDLATSPDLVCLAALHDGYDAVLRADDELGNVCGLGWQWSIGRQILDDTDADCDSPDQGSQPERIDSNRDGAIGVEGERNGQERWLPSDVAERGGTTTGGVRALRQAVVPGSVAASGKDEKTDEEGGCGS